MTVKEKLLEEKLTTLEQRLVLVERFVEMRFCETFRDFSTRNSRNRKAPGGGGAHHGSSPNYNNEDEFTNDNKKPKSMRATRQRETNNTKGKNKPGPASSIGDQAILKDCVVRVIKYPKVGLGGQEQSLKLASAVPSNNSPSTHRYGTRKQTRMAEPEKVKCEVISGPENDNEEYEDTSYSSAFNEMDDSFDASVDEVETVRDHHDGGVVEDSYSNADDDEGEEYFTFPTDQIDFADETNPEGNVQGRQQAAEDDNDTNWDNDTNNDDEDDADDGDYAATKSKSKGKQSKKRKRKSTSEGVRKRTSHERRKASHLYYLASIPDLSKDTKIVSTDPTRAECPICKQYWKVERLDQHIATHMKERHLKCSQCDKTYFSTEDLKHHMKITHLRAKYYPKCRLCNTPVVRKMILHEKYCVKKALQNGMDVEDTLVEDIRQQCAKEGLEFVLPDETVPPGMDPAERIKCPHCKKCYQRRVYDRHVKTHSLARNWKCTKCPKTYIHKHDLIRHMCITHEVSLKCKFCEETFETRMQLRTHQIKCRRSKGLVPRPRASHLGYKALRAIDPPHTLDIVLNADESIDQEATENDANTTDNTSTTVEDEPVPVAEASVDAH